MDIADFSLDLFSLAGRNALVTGGNTGLGRAFSVALAKAGADVFAVGLAGDDGTTRRLIEHAGRRMEFMAADITQPGVPAAIVRRCVETLGSVDILVNCAGIALLSDVEEFGRDQWDPMVAVNLTAAFELAHEASKFMIEQRSGKIINIASLFSFLGGSGHLPMRRPKPGSRASPRPTATSWPPTTSRSMPSLRDTSRPRSPKRPGPIPTPIAASSSTFPRPGGVTTADLMGATVFLASRASDYVNGHVLVVDGGYLVR